MGEVLLLDYMFICLGHLKSNMFYLYYRAQKQSRKFHDGKHTMQPESVKLMRAGKLPLPEDRQWVAKTRDNHRTASRVLMAVFSEREKRNVHYRDFFAFGTEEFLEPEIQILEMLEDFEKSPNIK